MRKIDTLYGWHYKSLFIFIQWIIVCGFTTNLLAQSTDNNEQNYALSISLGKDSTKTWDGEVTFLFDSFGDKFMYAGVKLNFMKTGKTISTERNVKWEGKAEYRKVFNWAIPFNKMVDGYTSEKDYFPFEPFEIDIHFKSHPDQILFFNTVNGSFKLKPSDLKTGMANYYLDSQVVVTNVFPALKLTNDKYRGQQKKYHGFPSITSAPDGTTYTVYTTYYEGDSPYRYHGYTPDNLPESFDYLAQKAHGDGLNLIIEKNGAILDSFVIAEKGRDIAFTTCVLDSNNQLWVCWTENSGGNKDIFATKVSNGKMSEIRQITSSPGIDIHPVLSTNKNGVVVVWQGFRNGNFDILFRNLSIENAIEQNLSNTDENEWHPAICSDSKGRFAVAWDSYKNMNYDVFYAIVNDAGDIIKKKPVTTSLNFEVHPSVVFDHDDKLWIAYETAGENWGKDYGSHYFIDNSNTEGLFTTRSIRLVGIENDRFFTTKELIENAIPREKRYYLHFRKEMNPMTFQQTVSYNHYVCAPYLAISANGHLCLTYKKNADIKYTNRMENYFIHFNGLKWSKPVKIAASSGQMHEKPMAIGLPNGSIRVIQASEREAIAGEILVQKNNVFRQDIWQGIIDLPDEVYKYELTELNIPAPTELPKELKDEKEDIKTLREYRADIKGKSFRILKGDSHRHSTFSGDGAHDSEMEDSYRYALDAASLDWMSNGDHDNGYNEYYWNLTQKYTDLFHIDGYFSPLFGYERSCRFPDGHRNILFAHRGVRMLPRVRYDVKNYPVSSPDTRLLNDYLDYFDGICISHTSASEIQGTDWRELNENFEPVMEIYQGERMSAECRTCPRFSNDYPLFSMPNNTGFFWDALKKGHHIGVIASSDHRSTHVSFAMVYAEEFSREGIMDGIKKRHTYGATDNIVLDVRMNDTAMMGDVIKATKRKINIYAIGTDKIKEVILVKDEEQISLKHSGNKELHLEWTDMNISEDESSYYVRIMQEDGQLAWSSPIWVINK